MTNSEMKMVMKPLVKQCLQEMLLEEGLLSKLIGEVMKGQNSSTILEAKANKKIVNIIPEQKPKNTSLNERKKLADKIGIGAYENIFEGVTPITSDEYGMAGNEDDGDPGIDLSMLSRVGLKSFK